MLSRVQYDHPVRTLMMVPDGRHMIIGTTNNVVRLVEVTTGVEVLCLANATSSAIACDGRYMAVGFTDGAVRVFELPDGKEVMYHKAHLFGGVTAVMLSSDGRYVFVGFEKGITIKGNLLEKGGIGVFGAGSRTAPAVAVSAVAVTPDGQHAVTSYANGSVYTWKMQSPPSAE